MTAPTSKTPFIAIACGGTGGHLFPGIAVAGQLQQRGCTVALLISPRDVDQQAVQSARGMEIFKLPAVGLQNRNYLAFARSFWNSFRTARRLFQQHKPDAVLAMGGFTSAPPVLAARKFGAKTFLHESNTVPGRANRLLSRFVNQAFVGFPEAAPRLKAGKVSMTGTPVRAEFNGCRREPVRSESERQTRSTSAATIENCRTSLGLDPHRPVVLIMGGSQGASGLNRMVLSALPALGERVAAWQWLHLTGPNDFESVKQTYVARGAFAVVRPFLSEMDLALGAATISVSRSGASSLAEIAAMRLPSLLVPYPTAADNHQWHNARAFEITGAARVLEQKNASPETVAALLMELVESAPARGAIQSALAQWHAPNAAEQIAEIILQTISQPQTAPSAKIKNAGVVMCTVRRSMRIKGMKTDADILERSMSIERNIADELAARVSRETLIRCNEPLARHTTIRLGGPADVYVEPASENDLAAILQFCTGKAVPLFVIGRGSNLLVRDGGVRGVVVCLAQPAFSKIEITGERLVCGAGARLKNVSVEAKRNSLSGVEFLEGIPGSVGGALRMNAGAMGKWTFEAVESLRFMDPDGQIHERAAAEVPVEYRSCPLLRMNTALGAVFKCTPLPRTEIELRMKSYSEKRWESQPAAPSAGCIFKNPGGVPAGKLVDDLGLKGLHVGGAMVSLEHGNFIVNGGTATAGDVLELIELLKTKVRAASGIELHTEVEIVGG